MSQIRISPERVRGVASEFQRASHTSNDLVQTLTRTIRDLDHEWEGLAHQKFMTEFEQWQRSMTQFVTLLDGINQQLLVVAQRFEEADKPA